MSSCIFIHKCELTLQAFSWWLGMDSSAHQPWLATAETGASKNHWLDKPMRRTRAAQRSSQCSSGPHACNRWHPCCNCKLSTCSLNWDHLDNPATNTKNNNGNRCITNRNISAHPSATVRAAVHCKKPDARQPWLDLEDRANCQIEIWSRLRIA